MRTDLNLVRLKETLASNCGDEYDACLQCGLSVQFVAQWRADDPEIDADLREAQRLGAMRIESALIRRAVHGIMQPVFYQGEVCGYKPEYSDGLLQTLVKGRLPHIYAPDSEGGGKYVFNGPTQINNMPRAGTYEEWLSMKTATLAIRDDSSRLPAVEGQFQVLEPPHAFTGVPL